MRSRLRFLQRSELTALLFVLHLAMTRSAAANPCASARMLSNMFPAKALAVTCTKQHASVQAQESQVPLPVGMIQGPNHASPHVNQNVTFRGIVTGLFEDQNTRGAVFYTVFVQDVPGFEDGDPATSDGIAVFTGRQKLEIVPGDIVSVQGRVTEFYGLTEIDDDGLRISVESGGNPLPAPLEIDPPSADGEAADYYERHEGLLVTLPQAKVVGPTHRGCGFAVVRLDTGLERVFRHVPQDPTGHVINVLHNTDVTCHGVPGVSVGDRLSGITGPLTYHFDRFKIVQQSMDELRIIPREPPANPMLPEARPGQVVLATFNLDDYFDSHDDTGDDSEPKPTPVDLAIKQRKLRHAIGTVLGCPTLIGVQEVETEELLVTLAVELAETCGFTYQVIHFDSPDRRGIDLALLTNPDRVMISDAQLRQTCTVLQTQVQDMTAGCSPAEWPLFSRPPLQVDFAVDDRIFSVLVNHFKSKRDGEAETEPRRLAQAEYVSGLVSDILDADSSVGVIVMGDFNDLARSPALDSLMGGGLLQDVLWGLPPLTRYTYIFDGVSELIDGILLSPNLVPLIESADILHVNADYAYYLALDTSEAEVGYRSSDHDIPVLTLDFDKEHESPTPEPLVLVPASKEPSPRPVEAATISVATPRIATLIPTSAPDISQIKTSDDYSILLVLGASILALLGAALWRAKR